MNKLDENKNTAKLLVKDVQTLVEVTTEHLTSLSDTMDKIANIEGIKDIIDKDVAMQDEFAELEVSIHKMIEAIGGK